ncbi:MAG: hypothetical protein IIB66_06935 [Proteobacteria bacterium]|nr:hypothetical protein [Pseudomonadota bacterium]
MGNTKPLVLSGTIGVEGGETFVHALRRLREEFAGIEWLSAQADGHPLLRLEADPNLPEGAFRIGTEHPEGAAPTVTVTGGKVSGVIYGVEELIKRGGTNLGKFQVGLEPIEMAPGLTYRTFWTWDHSTNWELSQIGQQEIGVFNPYGKPPDGFLADYKRVVDYCSRNRIAAIVIYGFLRDSHGGIETAQDLCVYANERGVRIIPGIAIGAYGGVHWEGEHQFNLAVWLKAHPQFAATMEKGVGFQLQDLSFPLSFPKSDYTVSACPSAPETMDWMTDAVSWLAETFEIGGINIESGDYGVCGCERCVARRGNAAETSRRVSDHGDSWSHTDMAENFPRLFAAAAAKREDLWIYCEMQWDNLLDPVAQAAQTKLPEGGIYQYTANKSFWRRLRTELQRDYVESLPTQPNVLRCQFACQWNGDERTERYALNARSFADMARKGSSAGMRGLTVWGEPSPYHATVELSYLAFARFSYAPTLTWEEFLEEDAAPLLGGREAAEQFVAIAEELDAHRRLPRTRLSELASAAREYGGAGGGEIARRWSSLADQIARRHYMGA